MQNGVSALGGEQHWDAVNKPPARKRLARLAFLYDQWRMVKEQGLRQIRSEIPEPTSGQAAALASYEEMLGTMRAAVRMGERGDYKAYKKAYLQMVLAIEDTRETFAREGAPNICNFPI
jgi:hypothetical protein